MSDKDRIAALERRVAELERPQTIGERLRGSRILPALADDGMCDACRLGGICMCWRPERGPMCAVA